MTKILILNVGWANKGNVALIKTTMQTIEKFVPNVEFNMLGPQNLDIKEFHVKEYLGYVVSREKTLHYFSRTVYYLSRSVLINLLSKFKINSLVSKKSRLYIYYESDLIINSGGDQLSGESGIVTLNTFVNIIYAILLNKPVVLYGESLGYFKNRLLNSFAKIVFNHTQLILVREELSKKYLENNQISNPKIYVTADPAFLLEPITKKDVFSILSKEGINNISMPLIGINASALIGKYRKNQTQRTDENLIEIYAKLVDNIIEKFNATIIMIPHVYAKGNDDRTVILQIVDKVYNKNNAFFIKNEYSPEELKGIIGQCDLFIGARMHATIASTSMLVPTVGIAYSHKMHGIIGEMLEQEEYIIDINEFSYEKLIDTVNSAWENKEKIRNKLKIKVPLAKEKAMLNGKYVKELIDSFPK